jgi:Prokaryotic Cytochrome C oxidase subunit IV
MKAGFAAHRLTYVWVALSAITLLSWWLGHHANAHGHFVRSVPITVGVLAIGFVKSRLVIREFMEVRTAPTWLRLLTDGWLVVLWGAVLAIYLY